MKKKIKNFLGFLVFCCFLIGMIVTAGVLIGMICQFFMMGWNLVN